MKKSEKLFLIAFGILFCSSLCLQLMQSAASPDKELQLYNARGWLEGHSLYQGIFGVQPPLIYALYTVPIWLSKHLGFLEDYHYLTLLGFLAVAYVISLALRLIRLHPQFTDEPAQQRAFLLLLIAAFIIVQSPLYFVDREYLLFLLTFPYVLRFMPSLARVPVPSSLSVAIGFLACIGSGFKPQCLVVVGGVNLYYLLNQRSLAILVSRENIVFYLSFAVYLLLFFLSEPEYFTAVIPMALATYAACNNTATGSLFFFLSSFLPLCIALADFRLRYDSPYRKDILYLLAVAFWYFIYAMTNFGWGYSWNPLFSIGIIIIGFLLWEYRFLKHDYETRGLPVKPFVFGIRGCFLALAFSIGYMVSYCVVAYGHCPTILDCEAGKEFMKNIALADNHQPYTSFLTVDVEFDDVWPRLARMTGASWETRYNLWMLPMFFLTDARFASEHKWIMHYAGNAFVQDMQHKKPPLIFVADSDKFYAYPHYVDLIDYIKSFSPEFENEWKNYRFVGRIDRPEAASGGPTPYHGYYVYQRMGNN